MVLFTFANVIFRFVRLLYEIFPIGLLAFLLRGSHSSSWSVTVWHQINHYRRRGFQSSSWPTGHLLAVFDRILPVSSEDRRRKHAEGLHAAFLSSLVNRTETKDATRFSALQRVRKLPTHYSYLSNSSFFLLYCLTVNGRRGTRRRLPALPPPVPPHKEIMEHYSSYGEHKPHVSVGGCVGWTLIGPSVHTISAIGPLVSGHWFFFWGRCKGNFKPACPSPVLPSTCTPLTPCHLFHPVTSVRRSRIRLSLILCILIN